MHSRKQAHGRALQIFQAALAAADPAEAVRRHIRVSKSELVADGKAYPLDRIRRILVVGAGKATAQMAAAIEGLLGDRVADGLINVKYGHGAPLQRVRIVEAGHPVPDQPGMNGAREIADLVHGARKDDLVICLISGGASALLPLPNDPMSLVEKQALTGQLLACGADIHEMNTIRKHLSRIKGGQLARLAYPAKMLTLILSDVIGDDPAVIGSGPTAPDSSTVADACAVLDRFGLFSSSLPLAETPKPGDGIFRHVQNLVVGSNRLAMEAAARTAKKLGYKPLVLSSFIKGETRDVASMHAAIAREILATGQPAKPPVCVLSGGETTVTIRGNGKGGRNQEFVLAAAVELEGCPHLTVFSAGTDGTDGPTDAAGASADGLTVTLARRKGLDARAFLDRNDSYSFFAQTDGLVKTGPTGTNVMDLRMMLIG